MSLIGAVRINLKRDPYIGNGIKLLAIETRTNDTDYFIGLAAEGDVLADDLRIATEVPLPKSIADDGYTAGFRAIFLGRKRAASGNWRAEQTEKSAVTCPECICSG